jgi:hypothetical protein
MNCHLPDAPDEGFTAVGLPPDSRIITQQGGRFPPHAPLTAATTGAGGWVVGGAVWGGAVGAGAAVVGGAVVAGAVVGALVVDGVTVLDGRTNVEGMVLPPTAASDSVDGPPKTKMPTTTRAKAMTGTA